MLNQLENYLLLKKDITYFEKKLNKVEDIFTYFNITKEFFYSLVEKENAELALLIIIYKALNDGWIPDFNNEHQNKYYNSFIMKYGELIFSDVNCVFRYMDIPSGLFLKSNELAIYCKDTFFELYKSIYLD